MTIVCPSPARINASMTMLPAPPGRFSITTDCPSSFDTMSLTRRADTSVVPPGAKPTSTRIGRVGQLCAIADDANPATTQATPITIINRRNMGFLLQWSALRM